MSGSLAQSVYNSGKSNTMVLKSIGSLELPEKIKTQQNKTDAWFSTN